MLNDGFYQQFVKLASLWLQKKVLKFDLKIVQEQQRSCCLTILLLLLLVNSLLYDKQMF